MITHTRRRMNSCVYAQSLKRFITRNFSSQLNRILKTELVPLDSIFWNAKIYDPLTLFNSSTWLLTWRPLDWSLRSLLRYLITSTALLLGKASLNYFIRKECLVGPENVLEVTFSDDRFWPNSRKQNEAKAKLILMGLLIGKSKVTRCFQFTHST